MQILTNHDCFATIPSDAEALHKILLTQLKTTFKPPLLLKFRKEIIANTGIEIKTQPNGGKKRFAEHLGENPYAYS